MQRVYSADNLITAGYIRSLLEACNIDCIIQNQNLAGAMGEIPPIECWPEVWIMHDDDLEDALAIIKSTSIHNHENTIGWECKCGEHLEGQFSSCWKCGTERTTR